MPVSGLVIRLHPEDPQARSNAMAELSEIRGLELGLTDHAAIAAVLEADDYPEHDAALERIGDVMSVCSVDVVFHDFSDVELFGRLPRKGRG